MHGIHLRSAETGAIGKPHGIRYGCWPDGILVTCLQTNHCPVWPFFPSALDTKVDHDGDGNVHVNQGEVVQLFKRHYNILHERLGHDSRPESVR